MCSSDLVDPSLDPDGDGLPNGLELIFGTDPFNADTDGDGYSDGVEVASQSNPLDPTSTPLNSRISGDAESLPIGISNVGSSVTSQLEVDSKPFAVLNTGATVPVPLEVDSVPFSVVNNLTGTSQSFEADAIPFSVCNGMLGPCTGYSGLLQLSDFQSTGNKSRHQGAIAAGEAGSNQDPADLRPFVILGITPTDGAAHIARGSTVALAFSAAIDPISIVPANFALLAGNQVLDSEIRYSVDFRTVTIKAPLPPDTTILLRVSNGVHDFLGRSLPTFQSQFHTAAVRRTIGPSERSVVQRPGLGTSGVSPGSTIHLSFGSTADLDQALRGLRVTQAGESVEGWIQTTSRKGDVEFVPYAPLGSGEVVKVSLETGNGRYEGMFTTANSFDVAGPLRAMLGARAGTPLNAVMEIEYGRPLDRSSVTPATVFLRDGSNRAIEAMIMLRGDHIIRITPLNSLSAGFKYFVEISGKVKDLEGRSVAPFRHSVTAANEVISGSARLLATIPADGATSIDPGQEIHLIFDQPINPLTLNPTTLLLSEADAPMAASISLAKNGSEVIVTPTSLLKELVRVQLTLVAIEDLSGAMLPSSTIHFRVGPGSHLSGARKMGKGQMVPNPVLTPWRVFEFLIQGR